MGLQDVVLDGQLMLAALIALAAGIVSFASPCVLPLVPGYLAYVTGTSDAGEGAKKSRVGLGALLFVAGFTFVFVVLMAFAGSLALWFLTWQDLVIRILGVFVIAMGFVFMGLIGGMQKTKRLNIKPKLGLLGAPLLGVVFALGWAPCMGPTLTTIFALSYGEATVGRAVLLAIFYSLGLGLPFILIAFGVGWMGRVTSFFRTHIRAINITGGTIMIVIGLLMVTGVWSRLMSVMQVVVINVVPPL